MSLTTINRKLSTNSLFVGVERMILITLYLEFEDWCPNPHTDQLIVLFLNVGDFCGTYGHGCTATLINRVGRYLVVFYGERVDDLVFSDMDSRPVI